MSSGNLIVSGSKILKSGLENSANKELIGEKTNETTSGPLLPSARSFIDIPITQTMVPSCRLLVYYVRDDKETVAEGMVIDVEDVLENQVGGENSRAKTRKHAFVTRFRTRQAHF